MSQFDWEFVGSALLERERRPVLVLDLEGRIVRANRALLLFIEESARTHQVHFADEWVLPESRATFREAWQQALAGQRPRVSVPIRPSAFHVEPVFELMPLVQDGQVRSVMMVIVDAVASSPSLPLVPAAGLIYEVALGDDAQPRTLLRALSAQRPQRYETGPCFRVLHGRDQACAACPVASLPADGCATAVRLDSSLPFKAEVLSARRTRADVVSVTSMPLDERTYSSLVQARVEALSARARLSPRERSVLALLLMGRNLDDIGTVEGITARTAKYHQQNLLRKLGAESRADLFRLLS